MKNYGYLRTSTRAQAGTIPYQRDLLSTQCVPADAIFEDPHISGRLPHEERSGLTALLGQLGPDDAVVITTVDRLARDLFEGIRIIRAVEARGAYIYFIEGEYRTDDPHGRFRVHETLALAEHTASQNRVRAAKSVERRMQGKEDVRFRRAGFRTGQVSRDKFIASRKLVAGGKTVTQACRETRLQRRTYYRLLKQI